MKKSSFSTILFAISLVMSTCSWSSDVHVELGAGMTKYGIQPDGVWYQIGEPHTLALDGRAYSVGLTGPVAEWDRFGLDWHAGYVNLGHIRSGCSCTTDANYDMNAHRARGVAPVSNAYFSGHGGTQGVLMTLAPYAKFGDWRIGAKAGLFPYRPDWQETVYGWSAVPGPTQTIYTATPTTWRLGKMFGAFVQHGRVSVSYEFYRLPTRFDDRHPPALWTGAHVLMVSYEL